MENQALSKRRLSSTLSIGLLPLALGVLIYAYWLYEYFVNFNISPLGGSIKTIGYGLLIISLPANFLAIIFLFTSSKKNRTEVDNNPILKRRILSLYVLLGLNYIAAAGVFYNYYYLTRTISIEFTNNFSGKINDLIVVQPNGDAVHMKQVLQGQTGSIRFFVKGAGQVSFIAEDQSQLRAEQKVFNYIAEDFGGRARVTLSPDFVLSSYSGFQTLKSE